MLVVVTRAMGMITFIMAVTVIMSGVLIVMSSVSLMSVSFMAFAIIPGVWPRAVP